MIVIVYVVDVAVRLVDPGEVAVTEHWPAERAVSVAPLITHGPVSDSTTVAPDCADAVSTVFEPARNEMGRPGFQGVPPCGATVMTSDALAGWMFTV